MTTNLKPKIVRSLSAQRPAAIRPSASKPADRKATPTSATKFAQPSATTPKSVQRKPPIPNASTPKSKPAVATQPLTPKAKPAVVTQPLTPTHKASTVQTKMPVTPTPTLKPLTPKHDTLSVCVEDSDDNVEEEVIHLERWNSALQDLESMNVPWFQRRRDHDAQTVDKQETERQRQEEEDEHAFQEKVLKQLEDARKVEAESLRLKQEADLKSSQMWKSIFEPVMRASDDLQCDVCLAIGTGPWYRGFGLTGIICLSCKDIEIRQVLNSHKDLSTLSSPSPAPHERSFSFGK